MPTPPEPGRGRPAWQVAQHRAPGATERLFASPIRGGTPTPLAAHGGHLWHLEAGGLWAVPLTRVPAPARQHPRAAPDWTDSVQAARASTVNSGLWHSLGATPYRSDELQRVLTTLGLRDVEVVDAEPVIRQVHATVYAEVDTLGRIQGWHACEPGAEPVDSGQAVWNTATNQWECPDFRADRVWGALDQLLDTAPTDQADTPDGDIDPLARLDGWDDPGPARDPGSAGRW